jgi:hypothetical protein
MTSSVAPRRAFTLPASTESFFEIVTAALQKALLRPAYTHLHERTEGDLRLAADGFDAFIRRYGTEEGIAWALSRSAFLDALPLWEPPGRLKPLFCDVPRDLTAPLRICGRAGRSFPKDLAANLLLRFADRQSLPALLDHGYLCGEKNDRLCFVTDGLWREAGGGGGPDLLEVDQWLNSNYAPDLDRIDDALQASAIARRAGDRAKEAWLLSQSMMRADSQRRSVDVLRVLAYPDSLPVGWTLESVLEQVERIRTLLGSDWSEGAVLAIAGVGLRNFNPTVS